MAWTLDRTSDTTVTLTVTSPTGRLTLNGVPHLTLAPGYDKPASAVLSGNTLLLTYPSTFGLDFVATLPPGDPALRNPVGAYLSAQAFHIVAPGTTTVEFFGGSADTTAQVGVANAPGSPLIITYTAGTQPGQTRWIMSPDAQAVDITLLTPDSMFLATISPGAIRSFTWDGTSWA